MIKIFENTQWYLMIITFIGVMSTSAMDRQETEGMKDDSSKWYGGTDGQSYFSLRRSEIVDESVVKLKDLVLSADKDEVVAYFELHFTSLGETRKGIAIKTGTEDSNDFGLPRINLGETLFTPLSQTPQYAKWHDCFQAQLTSSLQEMSELEITSRTISDDESSITITIEPFHQVMHNLNYTTAIQAFLITPRPTGMAQVLNNAISEERLYLVKSQTKVLCDGTWIPTVAYLTALYTQNRGDKILHEESIKTFRDCGILAIHTKEVFIAPLLNKTANIWKDALLCNVLEKDGLPKLKTLLADFRYMTSQLTYFKRGSAAIAEWAQEILLKFHGLRETYNNDWTKLSVDLNALTLQKRTFEELFGTNISCKQI